MAPFIEHFASLPDPRVVGRSDHKLLDIIAIAILGTICGALWSGGMGRLS